jgi:endonuclease/exonuclease/phosphatase family metal-dependent hydrolase
MSDTTIEQQLNNAQATGATMSPIRVMSFNVFLTNLDEVEHFSDVWANRADFNIKTIKRYQPDVIAFQELDHGHLATYEKHLTKYSHCLADSHAQNLSNAIYWNAQRFQRHKAGTFWLSRTPDEPSNDWGVPYPLGVTWVLLEDSETGSHILFANTQFEDGSWGEESRRESSKLMVRRLPQIAPSCPIIVTGDFNCNPWTVAYQTFVNHGFSDTYRAAGHGDSVESSTFHGFHGARYFALEWGGEVFWRVDWILSRDGDQRVQTTSCTIVRDAEPPVFASDHYPVVTEFVLLDQHQGVGRL